MKKYSIILTALLITFSSIVSQTVSTLVTNNSGIIADLTVDSNGNIYITQGLGGSSISKITPDGIVSTYVSGLNGTTGITIDDDGNLYVGEYFSHRILKIETDSTITTYASGISGPGGLAFDQQGNLYVANFGTTLPIGNGTEIYKITNDGTLSLFATHDDFSAPVGITVDENSNIYVTNANDNKIFKLTHSGNNVEISLLAEINGYPGLNLGYATLLNDKIYTTSNSHRIFQITLDGNVSLFAGTGTAGSIDGPIETAEFNGPNGITEDLSNGVLYVSDYISRSLRKITFETIDIDLNMNPTGFQLKQNYPNPFNPETTIEYFIPEASKVSLKVYNSLGKEVAELLNESKSAGFYSINFDASSLISGNYSYKLESGKISISKKLILIK